MALKDLQTPSIIEVVGEFIRIAHPDIKGNLRTNVASPIAASGTSLTVLDNNGFSDGDDILFGSIGDSKTEAGSVNGAVTRGTSLTISSSNKFAHEIDCPVTKLNEDQITIFDAADDSEIATVDIQWDKEFTEYEIAAADQSSDGYYVKFTDGTNVGVASETVTSSGLANNSIYVLCEQGLDLAGEEFGGKFSEKKMLRIANACQDEIVSYAIRSRSGFLLPKNWSFELTQDESTLSLTENENRYALSGLGFTLKNSDTNISIQSVRIGSEPLRFISVDEYERDMRNAVKTTVSSAISASDTTITLSDTYEFGESGVVYIGEDTIQYTGNTEATGTLTGCTGVDNDHSVGDTVWQNISPGEPTKYTVFNGYIYLNVPVETDLVGYKLKVRGYKQLDRFTDMSDTTDVSFPHIFKFYIASFVYYMRGDLKMGSLFEAKFKDLLEKEAKRDTTPLDEESRYKDVEIVEGEVQGWEETSNE